MEQAVSGDQVMTVTQFLVFTVCFAIGYALPEVLTWLYERIKYGNN